MSQKPINSADVGSKANVLVLISHFTVTYSVTRPMNGSEAAGYTDLAVFIM